MKYYRVTIKELKTTNVDIEANNIEEAEELAREGYRNDEYSLDAENYVEYKIRAAI